MLLHHFFIHYTNPNFFFTNGEEALQEFSSLDNVDGNAISGLVYGEDSEELGKDGQPTEAPPVDKVPLVLSLGDLEKDVERKLIREEDLKVGFPCKVLPDVS